MSNFILVAETGADIPKELAILHKIEIVPMHISFGTQTKDDMTFPVQEVFDYYKKTNTLPKTSGCTPQDFETVFDRIHSESPDKHIIYLAYSAVTTCSFQSGVIASEGRDYITCIDTKSCTAGQAIIVLRVAKYLENNENATLQEVKELTQDLINRVKMCFLPGDLVYLKAGGRVSNAQYMGAKMLSLNPLIEIEDGRLVSKKKYRGTVASIAPKLVQEFSQKHNIEKDLICLLYSGNLDEKMKQSAEKSATECGYNEIMWVGTGCVISTHGGPGAFGITGFTVK